MIQLCTDGLPGVTCVPDAFIDEHMGRANGDFVKIYLYLLRSLSAKREDLSIGSLADAMNFTEADVVRALRYWETDGCLCLFLDDAGCITGINLVSSEPTRRQDSAPAPAVAPIAPAAVPAPAAASAPLAPVPLSPAAMLAPAPLAAPAAVQAPVERPQFSPEELASFRSEEGVKDLILVAETYLGRPLSVTELESLLYWHKDLLLPIDLIEHLIESCLSANHTSFRYMDTVARNWHSQGIRSVDQARNTAEVHNVTYYGVKNALGISGRELIDSEKDYITKWTDDFDFSLDIIKDACRRTIEQASSPSFRYVDSILTRWHKAGVRHLSDVATLDAAHQLRPDTRTPAAAAKFGFTSRSEESVEELEKRLLLSTGQ